MTFIWNQVDTNWIIDLVLLVLSYSTIFAILLGFVKRKAPYAILSISFVCSLACFIFKLNFAFVAVMVFTGLLLFGTVLSNMGDFNRFLANPFKKIKAKNGKKTVEKIVDKKSLYAEVETAVLSLAKSKTGAIITFEKNKSLNQFLDNGVKVNAPFSPELIETIFYEGTRLHDGAVIVNGDTIEAAAVFFSPTNKTFANKLGARHRAAIGISEVSDSVTVVVSEETGKISFAVGGQLETVSQQNFLKVFTTYMQDDEE